MAHLKFTTSADSTQLEGDLSRMEKMGEHFSRKFQRHLSHAFGVGFFAVGAVKLIEQIFERPEKIEEVAKKFSLTTDEVQLLEVAAKEAGMTMEEYMHKAAEGALNLSNILSELRHRGDIKIIPEQTIRELGEAKGKFATIGHGIVTAVILQAGALIDAFRRFGSGDLGMGMIQLMRGTIPGLAMGISPKGEAGTQHGMGWMPFLDMPQIVKGQKEFNIRQRLHNLMEIQDTLEEGERQSRKGRGHWSHGGGTDWQGIGAFSALPSVFTPETTDERLEDIRREIKTTNEELRKLREGTGG